MLIYEQILEGWKKERFQDKSPKMGKNKVFFEESKDQRGFEISFN